MLIVAIAFDVQKAVSLSDYVKYWLNTEVGDTTLEENAFFTPDFYLDPHMHFVDFAHYPTYNSPRLSYADVYDTVINTTAFLIAKVEEAIYFDALLDDYLQEMSQDSTYWQTYENSSGFFATPLSGHPISKDMIFVIGSRKFFLEIRHLAGAYDRIWVLDPCGTNIIEAAFGFDYASLYFILNLNFDMLPFNGSCDISLLAVENVSRRCEEVGGGRYKQILKDTYFIRYQSLQYILFMHDEQDILLDSRNLLLAPYHKIFFCCRHNLEYEKRKYLISNNTVVADTLSYLSRYLVNILHREIEDWTVSDFICNGVHIKSFPVFEGDKYQGFVSIERRICDNVFMYRATSLSGITTSSVRLFYSGRTVPLLDCAYAFLPDTEFSPPIYLKYEMAFSDKEVTFLKTSQYIFGQESHVKSSNGVYSYGFLKNHKFYRSNVDEADLLKPRIPRSYSVCTREEMVSRTNIIDGNYHLNQRYNHIALYARIENTTCAYDISQNEDIVIDFPAIRYFKAVFGSAADLFARCVSYFLDFISYADLLAAEQWIEACQQQFPHQYAPHNLEYFYNVSSTPFSPFLLDFLQDELFELGHFAGHAGYLLERKYESCYVFVDSLYQAGRLQRLVNYINSRQNFTTLSDFLLACDNMMITICSRDASTLNLEKFTYDYDKTLFNQDNDRIFAVTPITTYDFNFGYSVRRVPDIRIDPLSRYLLIDYYGRVVFNYRISVSLRQQLLNQLINIGALQKQNDDELSVRLYPQYAFNAGVFYGRGNNCGVDYENDIVFAFFESCANTTLLLYRFDTSNLLMLSLSNYDEYGCGDNDFMQPQMQLSPATTLTDTFSDQAKRNPAYQIYVRRISAAQEMQLTPYNYSLFITALCIICASCLLIEPPEKANLDYSIPMISYSDECVHQPVQTSTEQPESPFVHRTNVILSQTADFPMSPGRKSEDYGDMSAFPVFPLDITHLYNVKFVYEAQEHFLPSIFVEFLIFDERNKENALTKDQIQYPDGILAFYRLKYKMMTQLPYYSKEFPKRTSDGYFCIYGLDFAALSERSNSSRSQLWHESLIPADNVYAPVQGFQRARSYIPSHFGNFILNYELLKQAEYDTYLESRLPSWLISEGFWGRDFEEKEIYELDIDSSLYVDVEAVDATTLVDELISLVTR